MCRSCLVTESSERVGLVAVLVGGVTLNGIHVRRLRTTGLAQGGPATKESSLLAVPGTSKEKYVYSLQ